MIEAKSLDHHPRAAPDGLDAPATTEGWTRRRSQTIWLIVVLAGALGLRVYRLDAPLMWSDEAESAINALTILEQGYPGDTYLGQPIFENIFTQGWPEHPEFEFRDTSYSSRGLAVYHGWLPLYTIAGSLWAFGIEPAGDVSRLQAKYSDRDIRWRTMAARVPSVIIGMAFLVIVYVAGRQMYGADAAWAGLLAAALAPPIVHVARQARYYSLTVLLCTVSCLLIWRMTRQARLRDYLLSALVAVLLFHTHLLTFLCVIIAGLILMPLMLRHRGAIPKMLLAACIGAIGTVPWIIVTDFLGTARHVPKAFSMLKLPSDLLIYPLDRLPLTLFLVGSGILMLLVDLFKHRLPQNLRKPFIDARSAYWCLAIFGLIGWLGFMFLIPAASMWFDRAYLAIVGPGIVLGAIVFAAIGRVIGRRRSIVVGCLLFLAFLFWNLGLIYSWQRDPENGRDMLELIARMRNWELRPGTRVYATPSEQLMLTYYTDVPVQGIAPVRKTFLDRFENDIVLIECIERFPPVAENKMLQFAREEGQALTRPEAKAWGERIAMLSVVQELELRVREVNPPFDLPSYPLPHFAEKTLQYQRELSGWNPALTKRLIWMNPAIYRGYETADRSLWWQIFFYRFVGVEERSGKNVNYADRIGNATATVLPGQWVIYHSPGGAGTAKELGVR